MNQNCGELRANEKEGIYPGQITLDLTGPALIVEVHSFNYSYKPGRKIRPCRIVSQQFLFFPHHLTLLPFLFVSMASFQAFGLEKTNVSQVEFSSYQPPKQQTGLQAFLYGRRRDLSSAENAQPFDEAATKRLLRKLDWNIVPFLSLLYLYVTSSSTFFPLGNGLTGSVYPLLRQTLLP